VSPRNWEPNYRIDVVLRALAQVRAVRPEARLPPLVVAVAGFQNCLRGWIGCKKPME